jgi:hypothetical protein
VTPTVDRRPERAQPCCILCGTWVCHECWDWHRTGANRFVRQICTNCGGVEGEFVAVRHRSGNPKVFKPFMVSHELLERGKEWYDYVQGLSMPGHYVVDSWWSAGTSDLQSPGRTH